MKKTAEHKSLEKIFKKTIPLKYVAHYKADLADRHIYWCAALQKHCTIPQD